MTQPEMLDGLSRDELIARARAMGAQRPELLTRVELCDEIVRLGEPDEARRKTSRGWLGAARDLVASVVEAGLHMRDAAAVIRGDARLETDPQARAPVATVTLAEIYAAQGHIDRALAMLEQVLASEPDHAPALALREKLKREQPTAREERPSSRRTVSEPSPAPEPRSEPPSRVETTAVHAMSDTPSAESHDVAPASNATLVPAAPEPESPVSDDALLDAPVLVLWEHEGDAHLSWHVAPPTLARLEHGAPDGALVIRMVAYLPRREGAERASRDVAVRSLRGSATVRGFGSSAVLRAALGWSSARGFAPVAVAAQVDPRSRGEIKLIYTPPAGIGEHTLELARAALSGLDAA